MEILLTLPLSNGYYNQGLSFCREECNVSEWSLPRADSNTREYKGEKILLFSQFKHCEYHIILTVII